MREQEIFAKPRVVTSLDECVFYHSMDIPGYGLAEGMWDLRPNVAKYLVVKDLKDKRALDVGTASGYLSFYMESQGAEVISFDLSPNHEADVVPFAGYDVDERISNMQSWLDQIRNGYWLAHQALNSQAKVVYGNIYDLPVEIGPVDIAVYGSILLHLRDPFLALQNGLRLARETVIISEPISNWINFLRYILPRRRYSNTCLFVPDARLGEPRTTWWYISPAAIRSFIAVLGFGRSKTTFHFQNSIETGKRMLYYTVVGHRTEPFA
ncbi:MAG: hypothetical protein PVH65_01870 [Chloroflexota bacterium]|jgi:SAM-dependent methyltransferase